MNAKLDAFDIRNFLEQLAPAKDKGKYICPHCEGHNLSVNRGTGAYKCWNGCEAKDIREALSPWDKVAGNTRSVKRSYPVSEAKPLALGNRRLPVGQRRQVTPHRSPAPAPAPLPLKSEITLAQCSPVPPIPALPPQWKPPGIPARAEEIVYRYSDTQFVHRFQWLDQSKPKGRNKTFRQRHLNADGIAEWSKGEAPWPAYRQQETLEAIAALSSDVAPTLLIQEGEGCVDRAFSIGLASITFQGGEWASANVERFLQAARTAHPRTLVIFLADTDATGQKKARLVEEACNACGVPFVALCASLFLEPDCTELGYAADIQEILAQMSVPDFIRRLEEEIHRAVEARADSEANLDELDAAASESFTPDAEFTQKCLEILYSERPWICVNGTLYKWADTHYAESLDALELRRISNFCNGYAVATKQGIRYPYAKPSKVREALDWIKIRLAIDPRTVNPPGLNCCNGVLEITWNGPQPSWELVPHDPQRHLFLAEPLVTYDPGASPEHCERLLEVLEPPQREIFLRTIAASLDLATVRARRGREVRALLLKGDGSNGKDSLREVVSLLYGRKGLTACTFDDFAQADSGRKFPVASLEHSRVNWPSENSGSKRLDRLQSLKAAITGDDFAIERKGKDSYTKPLQCVHLFNLNDCPNLSAALDAIATRYGVLSFTKTFKSRPDPSKGELKADPRFKYDPNFLRERVLPAFLNRVLQALADLMREGIDYDATTSALAAIQSESNHLWQFAQETGLRVVSGGKIYAGQIWARLKDWYLANGHLEIDQTPSGKEKLVWCELPSRHEQFCKAANQVPARFGALFPKAKKGRDENGTYLSNLAWGDGGSDEGPPTSPNATPPPTDANCVRPDALADAVNHTGQGTDANDAILLTEAKNLNNAERTSVEWADDRFLQPAADDEWTENGSTQTVAITSTEQVEENSLKLDENLATTASVARTASDTASAVASVAASGLAVTASESEISPDLDELAQALSAVVEIGDIEGLTTLRETYSDEDLQEAAQRCATSDRETLYKWVTLIPGRALVQTIQFGVGLLLSWLPDANYARIGFADNPSGRDVPVEQLAQAEEVDFQQIDDLTTLVRGAIRSGADWPSFSEFLGNPLVALLLTPEELEYIERAKTWLVLAPSDKVSHPAFGQGIVLKCSGTQISCRFKSGEKRQIHLWDLKKL